jgi:hypothetical protein
MVINEAGQDTIDLHLDVHGKHDYAFTILIIFLFILFS